jgi:hypothetical protein
MLGEYYPKTIFHLMKYIHSHNLNKKMDIKNILREYTGEKDTQLISAFPGTGKSFYFKNTDKKVLDSDSSGFDKAGFPANYIEHIKKNIGKVDMIFISSHKEVRDALVDAKLKYTLVYPDESLKDEYLSRYKERGNKEGFIKLLDVNWEEWLTDVANQKGCKHVVLKSGEFLSDAI